MTAQPRRVRTHYDNLKVSRDAPIEVIKAAYRSLAQKHHPDRHSDDPDAARVMRLINDSFAVLSDPERRRAHDEWIRQQESDVESGVDGKGAAYASGSRRRSNDRSEGAPNVLKDYWGLLFVLALVLGVTISYVVKPRPNNDSAPWLNDPGGSREVPSASLGTQATTGSGTNPFDQFVSSGYVEGIPRRFSDGRSYLLVDNSQNSGGAHCRLYRLRGQDSVLAREFFVAPKDIFRVLRIRAGRYELRYKILSSGEILKTEPFELAEESDGADIRYTRLSLTLFSVNRGNMRVERLPEASF